MKNIFQIDSIKSITDTIKKLHLKLPKTCGLAFDVVPVRDFHFYQILFNSTKWIDCTQIINKCRQIKSSYEIEQIKIAGALSEKTFAYIKENIKPGIPEMEFAGEFETFARRLGHSGILLNRHYRADGFPFHLLSGENGGFACSLDSPCCGTGTSITHPYGAGAKIIQKNEPILIDFGTVLNGYHMDETRMFAMVSMEQSAMDASKASMEILYSILSLMKPGVIMGDIFDHSLQLAKRLGYEEQFLGLSGIKSIFIGHGIGLELVENPIISKGRKDILKSGMVFVIEPKFIFKNRFTAGIESVIQITNQGAYLLSTTPHEVFICK